jgi:predicted ester cyclase
MSHRSLIESFYAANGPMADDETLERTFHPDYVSHTSPPETPPGMATALDLRAFLSATFSDVRYRLIETVVEGDLVATYTRVNGVYTGDTLGFPGTGKAYEAEQMHLMRFAADGRVVEHWGVRDDAGMMRQISPDTASVV